MSETLASVSHSGRTVAIVTGASRGAGRMVALELSRRACAVVVVYLRRQVAAEAVVREANAAGGTALTVRADFTECLDVERLFDETIAAFGPVHIVVHAARGAAPELMTQSVRRLRRGGVVVSIPCPGALSSAAPDHDVGPLVELLSPWLAGGATVTGSRIAPRR